MTEKKGKRSPALLLDLALVTVLTAAIAAAATWWVHYQGYTLYYGDAQAHLNIATGFWTAELRECGKSARCGCRFRTC